MNYQLKYVYIVDLRISTLINLDLNISDENCIAKQKINSKNTIPNWRS